MILAIVMCVVTAILASKRGYNGFLWFFAGGLIGCVALSCLPDLKKLPAEQIGNKRLIGNLVAVGMTLLGVAIGVAIAAIR